MAEDELERRLRHLLSGRAEGIDPTLSGPQLRMLAGQTRGPKLRVIAPILAAAAVIVVALTPQLFSRHSDGGIRHQQPGGVITTPTRPADRFPVESPTPPPPAQRPRTNFPPQRTSGPTAPPSNTTPVRATTLPGLTASRSTRS